MEEMEEIPPRMTVQNLSGKRWLVTLEHQFSDWEAMKFTVLLPKSREVSLQDVEAAALVRVKELLTEKFGNT